MQHNSNKQQTQSKVWYKEPWPWLLMAGPTFVVIAATSMFFVAKNANSDMVSDDYYNEGKYIDMQIDRDVEAQKRNIQAQVMVSPTRDAVKVLLSGKFDPKEPVNIIFMHPAKQSLDRTVRLKQEAPAGDKVEYDVSFPPLPVAKHWYIRVEDTSGKWRVEDKWVVAKGDTITLLPGAKTSYGVQ